MDNAQFFDFVIPMSGGEGGFNIQDVLDTVLGQAGAAPAEEGGDGDQDADMPPLEPLSGGHAGHEAQDAHMPSLEPLAGAGGATPSLEADGDSGNEAYEGMPDLQSISDDSDREEQGMDLVEDGGEDTWTDEAPPPPPTNTLFSFPDNSRRRTRIEDVEDEDTPQRPSRRQRTAAPEPAQPGVHATVPHSLHVPGPLPRFFPSHPLFAAARPRAQSMPTAPPPPAEAPPQPVGPGGGGTGLGFVITFDENGSPVVGPPIVALPPAGAPQNAPGGGNNGAPFNILELNEEQRTAMAADFGQMMAHIFRGVAPETDDPTRARRLVEALDEVPEGLVRRIEQVAKSQEGESPGCAICWDSLLDQEGDSFAPAVQETVTGDGEPPAADADPSKAEKKPLPAIVSLPCSHVFHSSCLLPWFARPKHTTCPTCRFNLDPDNLTRTSPHETRPVFTAAHPPMAGAGVQAPNPHAEQPPIVSPPTAPQHAEPVPLGTADALPAAPVPAAAEQATPVEPQNPPGITFNFRYTVEYLPATGPLGHAPAFHAPTAPANAAPPQARPEQAAPAHPAAPAPAPGFVPPAPAGHAPLPGGLAAQMQQAIRNTMTAFLARNPATGVANGGAAVPQRAEGPVHGHPGAPPAAVPIGPPPPPGFNTNLPPRPPLFHLFQGTRPMGAAPAGGPPLFPLGSNRTGPPREWSLPDAPGLSVRQRVEQQERELGLRCSDVSCGIGPSDDDPFPSHLEDDLKQVAIHALHTTQSASDTEAGAVCGHRFHASCLVCAERVAGWDGQKREQMQVPVACPVCRSHGYVEQDEWESGVQALAS